jgi:DNA-binding CsgD family transcriptional regulator
VVVINDVSLKGNTVHIEPMRELDLGEEPIDHSSHTGSFSQDLEEMVGIGPGPRILDSVQNGSQGLNAPHSSTLTGIVDDNVAAVAQIGQTRKTERRREVIALRRQGQNNRQIAETLGISERAVATLFYRAKQEGMDVPRPPYWSRGRR